MSDLSELDRFGRLWRVSLPLTSSLDLAIVTPEAYLGGPVNIGGIPSVNRRGGITVLGVACSFAASAAANVRLRSVDPVYIEGVSNTYDIWGLYAQGAGSVQQSVPECVWTLSASDSRMSPEGVGATLQLVTSTGITTGMITVWGIYGQADIATRKSVSGSPVVW